MSVPVRLPLIALATSAGLIWATGDRSTRQDDRPTFAGTWTLNAEKTEEPKDKVIEEPEATGAGRTMRPTGMGARGGGRGGSAGGAATGTGGERCGRASRSLRSDVRWHDAASRRWSGPIQPSVDDEDGPVFLDLRLDGKILETSPTNGWAQEGRNDVERSHDTNGSAREIFRIDPKYPKVLIVDFHYEHKRQRRTIDQRRIYDAGT